MATETRVRRSERVIERKRVRAEREIETRRGEYGHHEAVRIKLYLRIFVTSACGNHQIIYFHYLLKYYVFFLQLCGTTLSLRQIVRSVKYTLFNIQFTHPIVTDALGNS